MSDLVRPINLTTKSCVKIDGYLFSMCENPRVRNVRIVIFFVVVCCGYEYEGYFAISYGTYIWIFVPVI